MSYQVLARKWRPASFAALVGQDHVVRALSHALNSGRLHHAWLFTGTRGVGKTTISRLLAKALNCESGVSATPCGICNACRAIDTDRFPDYVEMDAASNRGVDDMAALLEQAVYAPVQGRCKVYMIDEVHMLTGHAFNAMLKTLEEPPEHVKFILATTDPKKIPVTVLSRCLQFNLKPIAATLVADHLAQVLAAEKIIFEPDAVRLLSQAAQGSMRDALSLLDQAIAHGAGQLQTEQVSQMLGVVGEAHLYALLDSIESEDVGKLLQVADELRQSGLSFASALQELAQLLHQIAVAQFVPVDMAEAEKQHFYVTHWSAEFIQLAYQIVIHGRDELPLAPDEYAGFTMTLLRLIAFRPDMPPPLGYSEREGQTSASSRVTGPAAQPVALHVASPPVPSVEQSAMIGHAGETLEKPVIATEAISSIASLGVDTDTQSSPSQLPPWIDLDATSEAAAPHELAQPLAVDVVEVPGVSQPGAYVAPGGMTPLADVDAASAAMPPPWIELEEAKTAAEGAAPGHVILDLLAQGDWFAVQNQLELGGLVRSLCQHSEWCSFANQHLTLRLNIEQRTMLEMNPDLPAVLETRLQEATGCAIRVKIDIGAIIGETPAQRRISMRQASQQAAETSLQQDPFVQALEQRFGAQLRKETVRPNHVTD